MLSCMYVSEKPFPWNVFMYLRRVGHIPQTSLRIVLCIGARPNSCVECVRDKTKTAKHIFYACIRRAPGLGSARPATEALTLETAGKTAQKSAGWAPAKCRETAEKRLEKHPKHARQPFFGCLAGCPAVFGCFPALYLGPTRHFLQLFSGSGVRVLLGLCSWSGRSQHLGVLLCQTARVI